MTTPFTDLVPSTVRREWASSDYYPDRDLYTLFAAQAHDHPDRQAVIDDQGELSYAKLHDLVRRCACGLQRIGITSGDVVGVQLSNGRLAVAVELALAAAGAVCLPYPVGRGDREAASMLGRSGATAAVVATEYAEFPCAERTLALADELPNLRTVVAVGERAPNRCVPFEELLRSSADEFAPTAHDPDGPARILVSSGSETKPKMVLYSHNALAGGRGRFMAKLRSQAPELRNAFLLPLGSAFGSHAVPSTMVAHGGTLLLQSRFDPAATWNLITRGHPTHLFGVPTMLRMLLEHPQRGSADGLQAIVVGGAPLDTATARRGSELLGCSVINLYGSADGVLCHTDIEDVPGGDGIAGQPDPTAADIRIVDDELDELPTGAVGEIIARGPMTPMRYVGAPELNENYRTETGWVRTGDAGYLDENGTLTIVGRRKDIIIRGGLNISPAQVEALLATHPDINDVACIPVTDPLLGERMCACVANDAEVTLAALTEHLETQGLDRRKFPEFLVVLPRLPLGPAGKVDRRALCELAEKRATSQP